MNTGSATRAPRPLKRSRLGGAGPSRTRSAGRTVRATTAPIRQAAAIQTMITSGEARSSSAPMPTLAATKASDPALRGAAKVKPSRAAPLRVSTSARGMTAAAAVAPMNHRGSHRAKPSTSPAAPYPSGGDHAENGDGGAAQGEAVGPDRDHGPGHQPRQHGGGQQGPDLGPAQPLGLEPQTGERQADAGGAEKQDVVQRIAPGGGHGRAFSRRGRLRQAVSWRRNSLPFSAHSTKASAPRPQTTKPSDRGRVEPSYCWPMKKPIRAPPTVVIRP